MKLLKIFSAALLLILPFTIAHGEEDSGTAHGVDVLEDFTVEQQLAIDKNAQDISELQSLKYSKLVIKAGEKPSKSVGEIVDLTDRSARVLLNFRGHKFTTYLDKSMGFFGGSGIVLFESNDCSGQGYKSRGDVINWKKYHWFEEVYLGPLLGGTDAIVPYLILDEQYWIQFEAYVGVGLGGLATCKDREPGLGIWAYPIESLSDDLNVVYPPPYRLVVED